ncbi:hypothetical protein Pcinc_028102 [Petrolisthes cinctipes]|uniref:Uncharacterized protein n=1 Tax=Petrolisthes cinctipes TaxID=88211 RepID=A0AAE1F3S5_PETCI|nr:hypothetical protein Pcinc_028102 [Petrolisthes cinctipes]
MHFKTSEPEKMLRRNFKAKEPEQLVRTTLPTTPLLAHLKLPPLVSPPQTTDEIGYCPHRSHQPITASTTIVNKLSPLSLHHLIITTTTVTLPSSFCSASTPLFLE